MGLLTQGIVEAEDTFWDDLRFPASRSQQGANLLPDYDDTEVGLLFPQNDTDEVTYYIAQLSHAYKLGTNIHPHVHWIQESSDIPVFKIDYRWYNNGEQVPAGFTTIETNSQAFTYTSGSILQISSFPEIDGSGITGVSSIIDIKLYRDDNVVSGDVLVKEFDIHFQIDGWGSDTEFIKNFNND